MESHQTQIMKKDNLGIFGIFMESMKIPFQNPKFIVFSVLASLPLFCAMLLHELALQQTLIPLPKALSTPPAQICPIDESTCYSVELGPLDYTEMVLLHVFRNYLFPGLVYFGIVLFLDVLTTVAVVNWASTIYTSSGDGDQTHVGFVNFKKVGLSGPLLTRAYVLLLASLTLIGLVWLVGQSSCFGFAGESGIVFVGIFGCLFLALFVKYEEWSALWNMAMVMSVVEGGEKQGIVAIEVSGYLSRGCRLQGMVLAVGFFVWRMGLRVWGLYMVWEVQDIDGVVAVNAVQVGLACVGNVMKWVVFVVYFCDCKKRFTEKKMDVEDGRAVPTPSAV